MNIQEAKSKFPELAPLSDADAVQVLHQNYYADLPIDDVAKQLGVDMKASANRPDAEGRTLGGTLKDAGITALKGAIAVPEAAVGLANLVTGGRAGKAVENMGVRFADAKKVLDEAYSEPQKQAFQNVANAEGFGGKLAAALDNSSVIAHTIGESLPGMVGGGLAGRALLKAVPKIGAVGAAAAGEGVYSGGQAAEQIRQETEDGVLTGKQSALAVASGAATGILGLAGGKVAQRLGINDLDTAIVRAGKHPGIAKNLVRRVLEGAAAEGVLEELPQSISEQVLENIAHGRPMDQGVDHAAALGLLSGAAMGGAVNVPRGGAPAVAPASAPAAAAAKNAPGVPGWTPPADVPAATLDEAALERAGVTPAARLDADRIEQMTGIGQPAPETRSLDERQIDALAPGDVQRGFDARVPGSMPPMALAQQAPTDGVDFKPGPLSRAASRAVPSVPDGGLALAPLEAPVAADPLAESAANAQALDDASWPVDLETGAPMFNEATASPEDMAVYQQFMSLEADPLDAAIPDIFSSDLAATAVSDEEFLRAMGATDEEIANAINTRSNPDVRQDAADSAPAADPAASSPGGIEGQGGQATRAATGAGEPAGAVAAEPGGQPAAVTELAEHDAVSDDAFAGAHVPDDMDADIEAANRMLADASLAQASQIPGKQEARASAGDAATNGGAGQAMAQPAEPEEVRAPSGGPFKAKLPAINAAKRKGEGWEPVQVEGGWVARKRASGQGGLEGKDLGDGWVEFSPGSGSLRIPRAEMPQIKAEHRGAMVNFMNARGVQHQEDSVPTRRARSTPAGQTPADRWFELNASEREKLTQGAGLKGIIATRMAERRWANLPDAVREKIAAQLAAPAAGQPAPAEFPLSEAESSYAGISHRGTSRAKADGEEFQAYIDQAQAAGAAVAQSDAQKAAVVQAVDALRADYLAQYRRLMSVRAGTYSGFVAGRSGLNSKQADKRNSAYDRALEAFTGWQKRSRDRVRQAALDARTDEEKAADIRAVKQARAEKAQRKDAADRRLMGKILSWKKGGEPVAIAKSANLAGVNYGKDGYPTSIKLTPTDGSVLTDDKFDLAALFRGKGVSVPDSKRRVRELVDAVRAGDEPSVLRAADADEGAESGVVGVAQADQIARGILAKAGLPQEAISTVESFAALPQDIQAEAKAQGAEGQVKGVFHRSGVIYLVADQHTSAADVRETVLHELMGHKGVRTLFGADYVAAMNRLFMAVGGWDGVKRIAGGRGMLAQVDGYRQMLFGEGRPDWSSDMRMAILTDELMAAMAQKPKLLDRAKEVIGAIRQWLRKSGFAELATYGETDLLRVLQQGRQAMQDRATAPGKTVFLFAGEGARTAEQGSLVQAREQASLQADAKRVQDVVDALRKGWANAPDIVVVADMRDPKVPEQVKEADAAQRSQGAEGDPEGFFYDGKVYLVASALPDAAATTRVLFHETLGHYGLRGVFGQELAGILHRFAVHRKADVIAKARQYGLVGEGVDVATATDAEVWASMSKDQRQYAAEEVLAQVAQDHPTQGFVRQAIAAIRTWLRAHVPGFADMRLSDGEVIRSFIMPARRFVESGQGRLVGGAPAFSLSVDQLAQAKAKWAATVDAFIRGGLDETKTHEVLPSSTEVMKAVGLPDLPIRAGVHALDALYNHGVKPSQMKQVLEELANPRLVMVWNKGSRGEMSLNFVTSMSNDRGEPFIIAIRPNKTGREGRHHWVATITQKQPRAILEMVRDGGAIYVGQGEIASIGAQEMREALRFAKEKRGKEARDLMQAIGTKDDLPNLVQRVLYAKDVASGGTDVQFSRAATAAQTPSLNNPADWRATANNLAADLFKTPGKVSWWHKTVGTMGDLARTSPKFKRTYDAVQRFISDVSLHANQAADAAPSILPKLDTWKDIGKTALSAEDTKALAAPVFEGTLTWARDETGKLVKAADRDTAFAQWDAQRKAQEMLRRRLVTEGELKRWQALPVASFEGAVRNRFEATMQRDGVVFTDAELRQHFKLDDRQIGLYRQFRAATDKSLAGMAISEMLRQGGEHTRLLAEEVMAESGPNVAQDARVQNAAQVLFEHLMNKADGLEGAQRAEVLELANSMQATAEKTTRLMEQGYAPLSRFGDYTVDVVGADGQRLYFGMFESRFDAGRMRRKMVQAYPDATVKQGTASKEAHKLFAGITPEALEIFGAMAGQDTENPVFQEYLRLAKDSRSATKRLIQRKGVAGFSEDVSRVLAGFIYSNSRLTATNLNTREIDQSLADFTNQEGELRDSAQKMADFVRNPQEAGQGIRAFMFAQYLGGSLASAIVNTTQPFAVTMPYLSQWAGVAGAGRHMAAAVKDAIKRRTGDAELDKALKRAEDEGVVSPQEVHQIMGMAMGKGGLKTGDGTALGNLAASASNLQQKVSVLWGQPFAIAEQFNRRSSFIAAYRIAQEQGMADPFKFAEQTVNDTQFVYNKGAKPEWARGAVGATLFTFKQYSVSYMELLYRMASSGTPEGRKAAMFALAMGLVISGVGGVPFMGDAEDIIDGILQRLGYSFSTKAARKQWLEGVFGKAGAEIIDSGFSGLPGMPLDVSGRLGMDNLIPGTGLLVTKADHTRDVGEVAGPAGDFVTRVFQGADMVSRGDVGKGVLQVMPNAVRNLAKGIQTGVEGEYTDTKGRKVIDAGWAEGITKAVGFQPRNVAQVQEATSLQSNLIAQNKAMRSRLVEEMTRAMYDRDAEAQAKVREKMRAWNRKNPDSPVAINMVSVRTKLKNMRMSKAERVAKTAPKDIRSEVRRQLADAGEAQ
ncbi:hypothetical protein CCO03_16845 [Comamonas serinivorans]|uniref:Phage MuF C-terminal domain-containing protein n=1 Tax=Comamonas serinivorans TaxID=1082851 RepID=A0A1Y0ER34_9BURK|nr:PLxRFG domain-containing protein [Comamonas serinivorans]ARU06115.1 hypothetical protein CCO03_16845 [Comamonas serinivorans]